MIKKIIFVAIGSAIGGVCRFLMHYYIQKNRTDFFPLGTLGINILGCFLIGLFYALATKTNYINPTTRIFLTAGICGGFTTYSSFMFENYSLIQSGQVTNLLLYVGASLFIGFAATALGIYIVGLMFKL